MVGGGIHSLVNSHFNVSLGRMVINAAKKRLRLFRRGSNLLCFWLIDEASGSLNLLFYSMRFIRSISVYETMAFCMFN